MRTYSSSIFFLFLVLPSVLYMHTCTMYIYMYTCVQIIKVWLFGFPSHTCIYIYVAFFLLLLAVVMSVVRRSFARVLLLIISFGFGTVRSVFHLPSNVTCFVNNSAHLLPRPSGIDWESCCGEQWWQLAVTVYLLSLMNLLEQEL